MVKNKYGGYILLYVKLNYDVITIMTLFSLFNETNTKYYTKEEIFLHNSSESCWIIVKNKVYDITPFLKNHPGGQNSLIKKGGSDCTTDLNFHSKYAKEMMEIFYIGKVKK